MVMMEVIYLVQEVVDLGYHAHSAWLNEERANVEAERKNIEYRAIYPLQHSEPFWVEAINVQ